MAKFSRVLIANRGEIAVRIARSVQAAGYQAIALFSEPDSQAPHVAACDMAVALGGATAAQSYLDIDKVLGAAQASGAQAIHPGYGFLSENSEFAKRCEEAGLVFIGPTPSAIDLMGSKRAAKDAVMAAGVPCIPGYDGADQSDSALIAKAKDIGLPVMVKASAGGGGRGMRLVTDSDQLGEAIISARREATNAFGNGELILEQAITTGRHIEIQVAADTLGNVIHLGERDCSLQRRHQKVVEEAPSPFVDAALREAMGLAAVNAAKACNYRGVGTVEFLVAQDRSFSFLEMNTRLQVEHPVTELVTGVDLVDLQLRIAQGEPLPLAQDEVEITGHAIEVRIYAEDPSKDFVPQTGPVLAWDTPNTEGLRVDSGICRGNQVSPYYDPMLAKVMAFGATRELARERLQRALTQTTLLGVTNNQEFLHSLLGDPIFVAGDATITYLDQHADLHTGATLSDKAEGHAIAIVASLVTDNPQPAHLLNWSNAEPMLRAKKLRINDAEVSARVLARGSNYRVDFEETSVELKLEAHTDTDLHISLNGILHRLPWAATADEVFVQWGAKQLRCVDLTYAPALAPGSATSGEVQASTEGLLVALEVSVGDRVSAGQTLAVVEAMKMQHRHVAAGDGVVTSIGATLETQVSKGQLLVAVQLDSDSVSEKGESQ